MYKKLDGTIVRTGCDDNKTDKGLQENSAYFPYGQQIHSTMPSLLRNDAGIRWLNNPRWFGGGVPKRFLYSLSSQLLVAYDTLSFQRMGYWGENGFFERFEDATPFNSIQVSEYINGKLYLGTMDGLYMLNEKSNKLLRLEPGRITKMCVTMSSNQEKNKLKTLFCIDGDHIKTYNLVSGKKASFPMPEKVKSEEKTSLPYCNVTQLNDNTLGLVTQLIYPLGLKTNSEEMNTYVAKISSSGKVLFERELCLNSSQRSDSVANFIMLGFISAINPLAVGCISMIRLCDHGEDELFPIGETFFILAFIGALIFCFIAAMTMLRRRIPKLKQRLAWAVFAVLTGFSGLVVIWILNFSEKKVLCPSCGKKRCPSQENCPFCKAQWPVPELRDIDLISSHG